MNIKTRKKAIVFLFAFLLLAALSLGVIAVSREAKADYYRMQLQNNYHHAFEELVTAVEEMDSALQKSIYARSPAMINAVGAEVLAKSLTAQMCLGVLPVAGHEHEALADYFSRAGDYAGTLSRSAAAGEAAPEDALEALRSLAEISELLRQNVESLQADLLDGVIAMDDLRREVQTLDTGEPEQTKLGDSLSNMEHEFPEMPALVYDGPFSEHLPGGDAAMLEGSGEADQNAGRKAAAGFLRVDAARVYPVGTAEGELPVMYFAARSEDGEETIVAVTKKGGKVLSMLSGSDIGEPKLNKDEAMASAEDFLRSRGYSGMEATGWVLQDRVLTANFAAVQSGVLCYPDLIKVSVAMDTGEICGFEAAGYIGHHRQREFPENMAVAADDSAALPEGLAVEAVRLALIPTAGGSEEVLCREYICSDGERRCLIYVNAETGAQQDILLLIEDEYGSMAL